MITSMMRARCSASSITGLIPAKVKGLFTPLAHHSFLISANLAAAGPGMAAVGPEEPFRMRSSVTEKGRTEPFAGRDLNGRSWHSGYDQERAKPVGFAPVTPSNWPSVAAERLPYLTALSGTAAGHA